METGQIVFKNFNGYWSKTEFSRPSLSNINITFKTKQFYGICGKIGSGKSGILGAILKEIPYYSGTFTKKGSVVYV
jgi:ATP-binding cassette subfamily C (CFTR/MRP) protein 4